MKNSMFQDIIRGLDVSNSILKNMIGDRNFDTLDDEQYNRLKIVIDEINNKVSRLTMRDDSDMVMYELWEVDNFYGKLLKNVYKTTDLDDARRKAKELSIGWCEDDNELHKEFYEPGCELWIGESDFGILVKKIRLR